MNGEVYDEKPGSPVDFAKLLNIQVPGKGQAPTDYKFNITGPGGESVQQLIPSDFIRLLQEIAEMHGAPGLSLVLSFLHSLKQVSNVAPGQTIQIDTQVKHTSLNCPLPCQFSENLASLMSAMFCVFLCAKHSRQSGRKHLR